MVPSPYKNNPIVYKSSHFKETPTHPCIFPQNVLLTYPTNHLDEEWELEIPHFCPFLFRSPPSCPLYAPKWCWRPNIVHYLVHAQMRRSQCSRSSQARILFPEPFALWSMVSLHLPHNLSSWLWLLTSRQEVMREQIRPSSLSL